MYNKIIKGLASFSLKRPLLVGVSGGQDSMALYQLLKQTRIPLVIAHVDHGWRKESADESQRLKKYFEGLKEVFISKRLEVNAMGANLEDVSREGRYAFFKEVYDKFDCQALVLAHHHDDLVETVLKRVFEGASLERLFGMKERALVRGMHIWRPLLSFSKKDLLKILENQWYIEDQSNKDLRFLRARMRHDLIPKIELTMGKKIGKSVSRISEQSVNLDGFMKDFLHENVLKKILPFGWHIERLSHLHPFALNYLVRNLLNEENEPFHSALITSVSNGLSSAQSNQWFILKKGALYQDRGELFYFHSLPVLPKVFQISPGEFKRFGAWELSFTSDDELLENSSKPIDILYGKFQCILPYAMIKFERYSMLADATEKKKIDRKMTNYKLPALLRHIFPIVHCNTELCLMGHDKPLVSKAQCYGRLSIKYHRC